MNTLAPGGTVNLAYGPLVVPVDMHHDVVAITITNSKTTLDRAFTDLNHGRAYLRYLRNAATAGQQLWQIEAGAGALTSTTAITDDAERDLIDRLNADLDTDNTERLAEHARVVGAVQDVMDGANPNWRRNLRAQVVQAAEQLKIRAVEPTRTRVHLKPLTAVELDLIRSHVDGVVTTRPGQSWLALRAICRRIGGEPTYRTGTQIISSRTLNAAGLAVADKAKEIAA
jgi:hypothetical protein